MIIPHMLGTLISDTNYLRVSISFEYEFHVVDTFILHFYNYLETSQIVVPF